MAELNWTPEAEAQINKAPFFVRGIARRAVEKAAREQGVLTVDLAFVNRVRQKVSPNASGGSGGNH